MVHRNLQYSPSKSIPMAAVGGGVGHGLPQSRSGALVCDGRGLIVSCSDFAARIFGGAVDDIEGRTIWSLISGFLPNGTSPGFRARYMAHLSGYRGWRLFHATDHAGRRFPLELSMLKIESYSENLFLLNVRQSLLA